MKLRKACIRIGNNMDLDTLFKTPRMGRIALTEQNSVQGLYGIVQQFFKPDFKMVEVGSLEGISTLLFSMFVDTVYSIDCYDYKVPPTGRIPEHDQMFIEAERMFIARTKNIPNIIKIRKTSIEAAKDFEDESLDAVYIDAEHDEDSVREDIRAWRPKIKRGGILSGHDFVLPHIGKILIEEEGFNTQEIAVAPDTSWAVRIPTIDLVAVACTKVPETIEVLKRCQKQMNFTQTILFTHEKLEIEGIKVVEIPKLDYWHYNEFVAMELWQHTNAQFVLLVQNDGYITNPELWSEDFLKFDYIGAPWPAKTHYTKEGKEVRVGNGGFSLRSRKLLRAPTTYGLEFSDYGTGFPHEDGFLCVHNRELLEKYGIKFAPVEVAAHFSTELTVPETRKSFGGHKYL